MTGATSLGVGVLGIVSSLALVAGCAASPAGGGPAGVHARDVTASDLGRALGGSRGPGDDCLVAGADETPDVSAVEVADPLDAEASAAEAAFAAGDLASAREHAAHVTAVAPDGYPEAWLVVGDVELAERHPAAALDAFEKASALAPDDPWPVEQVAAALHALGRLDEARARLSTFLAAHPDAAAEGWDALGWLDLDARNLDRARDAFLRALERATADSEAHYGLAIVAADRDDPATVARELEAAIALDPARRGEARADDAFSDVRADPRVQKLLAP